MNASRWVIGILVLAGILRPAGAQNDLPDLTWAVYKDLPNVRKVFCHPSDPLVAWATQAAGLFKTVDAGATWKPVAAASAEAVGEVTALACCAADDNRLVIGTESKGLLLSTDAGKTFKRMGAGKEKPAHAHIAFVRFDHTDPSWRTVMATHGLRGAGISITRDLGQTWDIQATDRYLTSFFKRAGTLVASGALVETEGRVWGIHRSGFDGQRWEEYKPGIRPGGGSTAMLRWNDFYYSTLDGEVLMSENDGRTWRTISKSDGTAWVSLLFTHGATDQTEILATYDPHRRGLVLNNRRGRGGSDAARSKGLYVGPFVKSGASCQANANGTVYYIVLNNSLWIGRRALAAKGPTVVQARCEPATLWLQTAAMTRAGRQLHAAIATAASGAPSDAVVLDISRNFRNYNDHKKTMEFTVQAQVHHPKGPRAVKAVTVNLGLLGGERAAALFDDGKHADGKAGDGLWARPIRFSPAGFSALPRSDRRSPLPGLGAMTVTAADTAGASASWSAVVSIQRFPTPIAPFPGGRASAPDHRAEEPVPRCEARTDGHEQAMLARATRPGPWLAMWGKGFREFSFDISGLKTISFEIKGSPNQELHFQIYDLYTSGADVMDEPHLSRPIALIGGGYLKSITPAYQKVRIPIKALLPKGVLFLRRMAQGVALSAPKGGKAGAYYIRNIRLDP